MDPYAALVDHLDGLDVVSSVHVELPHDQELRQLPCINLVSAGPAQRQMTMQGLGLDIQDIDVEIYVDESTWVRGDALRIANFLRAKLSVFRLGRMHVTEVTRPDKLPDRNPSIRRLGMTVSVLVPAPH